MKGFLSFAIYFTILFIILCNGKSTAVYTVAACWSILYVAVLSILLSDKLDK